MSVNIVFIVGNLGADPEIRATGGGTAVANLRIATTDRVKGKDGQWSDVTDWHNVVCFGQTADAVGKYTRKGQQVHIQGKIKTRKWQDKDGNDRYTTEIIADKVTFLGAKGDGEPRGEGRREPSNDRRPASSKPASAGYGSDEDIPF